MRLIRRRKLIRNYSRLKDYFVRMYCSYGLSSGMVELVGEVPFIVY